MRVPKTLIAAMAKLLDHHMEGHAASSCSCNGCANTDPLGHDHDCHVRIGAREYRAATTVLAKVEKLLKQPEPDLTPIERRVASEALNAALAGDPSEGDYCWNAREQDAAERASEKLA